MRYAPGFVILDNMIRRTLWALNRHGYRLVAKPLFFMMSPDDAHSLMIKSVARAGYWAPMRWFTKAVFVAKPNAMLVQKYHGVDYVAPVGLSAGLDKNAEIVPLIARLGFGFATVGSVTAFQCDGNPRPWFYRLPHSQSIVVNAGLANHGSDVIIKRIHDYSDQQIGSFPIVLSVAKTNSCNVVSIEEGIADYVTTVHRAQAEPRVQVIELNISCPNTYGGEPFTTPDKLERLLAAVDAVKPKQPVYIKMPVDLAWPDFSALLDVAVKHKIAGVTVSNLTKHRSVISPDDKLPDNVRGHLSGKPTWESSNNLIRQTYLHYGDKLTIIGVGGIFNAADAYTKIRLGASLVEVISGLMFVGPQLPAQINDGLVKLLKRDGFTHISQAIGVDAKK